MQNQSIYINATDLLATFCFNLHLASSLSHYHKNIYYSFFFKYCGSSWKKSQDDGHKLFSCARRSINRD